jgi:hypothetical protein
MHKLLRTLPLLFAALVPALAGADEAWQVEKDKDGIQISTRAVEGWSIREIRGTVRIQARLSSVVAVLVDVDASHELSDVVAEAKVLQRDSDTRYRLYSAMKLPWPVANREIINQREIVQDPASLAVSVTDLAVDDATPHRDGYVRMTKSRQQWTLTLVPGGEVQVEMHALADPAGPIPAFVVNAMAVDHPYKTLGNLRRMAQSAKYADASLPYIKEPAGK